MAQPTKLQDLRHGSQNATGALSFPELLTKSSKQIAAALPRQYTAERMVRIALTAFRQQPLLAKCDPKSVLASVFVAAQLGLEIGVLGHAYLLPFWNGKKNTYECQLVVGYQGYIDLARRTGTLLSVETHVIHEKDAYKLSYGLIPVFEHQPYLEGDPGAPRLVYCIARFKDGGQHIEVMTWSEIQKIKARSPSKNKDGKVVGPWVTDELEMARKTVVRRARKYWPQSVELATASEHDGKATVLTSDDVSKELIALPVEDDGVTIDSETGEILDTGNTGGSESDHGKDSEKVDRSQPGGESRDAQEQPDQAEAAPADKPKVQEPNKAKTRRSLE